MMSKKARHIGGISVRACVPYVRACVGVCDAIAEAMEIRVLNPKTSHRIGISRPDNLSHADQYNSIPS